MAGGAGRSVAGVSVFRLSAALQRLPQCRYMERGHWHGIDRGLFERPSETLSRINQLRVVYGRGMAAGSLAENVGHRDAGGFESLFVHRLGA